MTEPETGPMRQGRVARTAAPGALAIGGGGQLVGMCRTVGEMEGAWEMEVLVAPSIPPFSVVL